VTRGGPYVESAFPLRDKPRPLRPLDNFSTAPAPSPGGVTPADDIAWARARRRERAAQGQ